MQIIFLDFTHLRIHVGKQDPKVLAYTFTEIYDEFFGGFVHDLYLYDSDSNTTTLTGDITTKSWNV
tara:strand:- start:204 stop:401 length:198 start_codon:yes stop_codon:yes gene_type:complete